MPKQNRFRLWTPIANAFDAYRRRLIAERSATYEHIWRLIHIEESLVVTIAGALASRLFSLWSDRPEKNGDLERLKQMVTGVGDRSKIDSDTLTIVSSCLRGSIDAWNSLLNDFGQVAREHCAFCKSLSEYLFEESDPNVGLIDAWRDIAPVPDIYRTARTRIGRLKAINSLRNKLAHVPISGRTLGKLHSALKAEIYWLLTPQSGKLIKAGFDASEDLPTTTFYPALVGRLANSCGYVQGAADVAQLNYAERSSMAHVSYHWTADGENVLIWNATPFVLLDEELKVLLLFRLPLDDDFYDDDNPRKGEYYRFAAEGEPVQERDVGVAYIRPWLPKSISVSSDTLATPGGDSDVCSISGQGTIGDQPSPKVDLVLAEEESLSDKSSEYLREQSQIAYADRNYPEVVRLLSELENRHDYRYNDVTRLMHGEALWKSAQRALPDGSPKARLFREAMHILNAAAQHREPRYSARSKYQLSKVLRHLWELEGNINDLEHAKIEAKEAAQMVYEPQYISWYERIRNEGASTHHAQ